MRNISKLSKLLKIYFFSLVSTPAGFLLLCFSNTHNLEPFFNCYYLLLHISTADISHKGFKKRKLKLKTCDLG